MTLLVFLKKERKYKFIEGILHYQIDGVWKPSMKQYYDIKDINEQIIKGLKFIVQKKQRPVDIVSDFLLEIAEGFFPLFKKEGLTKEQVVFQRFQKNYLIDYFRGIKSKETSELPENIPYVEDESIDDLKEILRFYNLCENNKERLIILCELWKNYQNRFSEEEFIINVSNVISQETLDLFEMPKYFRTYMLNYSQCMLALAMNDLEYRNEKKKLFKKLRSYVAIT